MKPNVVIISGKALRDLLSVPDYIRQKLATWVNSVTLYGLQQTRKQPGFHDEPLKGDRKGQRSIRLNQAYRAFYTETDEKDENGAEIVQVEVIEVNKHKY